MLNVSVVRIDVLCLEKIPIKSNRKGKEKHKKLFHIINNINYTLNILNRR